MPIKFQLRKTVEKVVAKVDFKIQEGTSSDCSALSNFTHLFKTSNHGNTPRPKQSSSLLGPHKTNALQTSPILRPTSKGINECVSCAHPSTTAFPTAPDTIDNANICARASPRPLHARSPPVVARPTLSSVPTLENW